MKFTKSFVICSIGFFALASQTLLFRQFLVSFEGNELGIGTFFGSWFVWIGIGAVVASRTGSWIRPFANRVEFVSLLYLPAFFVQHILIAHARQIMGIDPYEYFGFGAMIATSLLVNAPVSFMTGILFPLACQWVESSGDMPVSRVYLWESAGSCLGGLAVTLALWQEISWPIIFFLSATLLSLSTASARWVKRKLWLPVLLLSGFLLAAVPLGIAKRWSESNVQRKWQRLIPQATYQGAFQTPQEYIYGNYQEDQFLVTSSGQVVETYPDRESAGRIAALHLAENPNELVTRFKGIEGSERIFPAEALETLFPKNRVAFARRIYESSDLPSDSLLNTDECPLAHLYSLLLLGRHTHYPFTRLIKRISLAGIWFFLLPIGVLTVVRIVYVWRNRRFPETSVSTFSSQFLVFTTGLVSIGSEIVLMYQFQTHYGSLYLYVGLIGALFMLGLAIGAAVSRWLISIPTLTWRTIALGTVALHCIALLSVTYKRSFWNYPLFILAFITCGLLTGMYFPLAARALEVAKVKARVSGGRLENMDHIGAALGGFVAGIFLLPVLGTNGSFLVLALLLAVNLAFISLSDRTERSTSAWQHPAPILRKIGYVCFTVAACVVLNSNLLARRQTQSFPYNQAAALTYGENIEPKSKILTDDQKPLVYYEASARNHRTEQPSAYIFPTAPFAGDVKGYDGPIHLAVRMDPNGVLEEYRILHSQETPTYLELLGDWPQSLQNRNLFVTNSLNDIAAVTGATMTCDAIKEILQTSGQRFGREILEQDISTSQTTKPQVLDFKIDRQTLVLLAAFCVAFAISCVGERWSRRVFLLLCLILCGWWFNLQYSIEQVATLLTGELPQIQLTHNFILVMGIPVLVLLFGNLYCGYLCPFGALQELIEILKPKQIKTRLKPSRLLMYWSRFGKYLVLFILICSYFCIQQRKVLSTDVLINFWFLTRICAGKLRREHYKCLFYSVIRYLKFPGNP